MTREYPTLYAKDSSGKVLQWNIVVTMDGMKVNIRKSYGEVDGKQAIRWQRNIKGKNIGKANETGPFKQACLEAESQWTRKKDEGYKSLFDLGLLEGVDINLISKALGDNRTDASGNIKPMKAQQYYRSKKDWLAPDNKIYDDRKYYYLQNPYVEKEDKAIIMNFPCMVQPKINGVRAIIKAGTPQSQILSKEGKQYIIPHLSDFLDDNFTLFDSKINLDGELYIHGEPLQEIASAVKKVSLLTQRVVFILFDLAIPNVNQKERWAKIKEIKSKLDTIPNCPIEIIQSFACANDTLAQQACDKFISQGYEGAIFRDMSANYEFGKRPMTMTKLKRVIDHEFNITDIVPQEKDPSMGNYRCITTKGLYFDVTPKMTEEEKRELLYNKQEYIGKKLTCTFYEWTPDGKPFHVISNIIRDYE